MQWLINRLSFDSFWLVIICINDIVVTVKIDIMIVHRRVELIDKLIFLCAMFVSLPVVFVDRIIPRSSITKHYHRAMSESKENTSNDKELRVMTTQTNDREVMVTVSNSDPIITSNLTFPA